MNLSNIVVSALLVATNSVDANVNESFQKPSSSILELVDVQKPPTVSIVRSSNTLLFGYQATFPKLKDLYQEEIKVAGLRINPKNYISTSTTYQNNLMIQRAKDKHPVQVKGLPKNPQISFLTTAPDESKIAFTHLGDNGLELWILDLNSASAKKVSSLTLNASLGSPITWSRDSHHLIVKAKPSDAQPIIEASNAIPSGPAISLSDSKEASQNRTYPDLLKNKVDEENFVRLIRTELIKVDLDGKTEKLAKPDLYHAVSYSPDGKYLLLSALTPPFSYLVRYEQFGEKFWVVNQQGKAVKEVYQRPLEEKQSAGFSSASSHWRMIAWRPDVTASLAFIRPLDKGNPKEKVAFRDELMTWSAPFSEDPKSLIKSKLRMMKVTWGDPQHAIMTETWFENRKEITNLFDPSNPSKELRVISERNSQDKYAAIGSPQLKRNQFGRYTLAINEEKLRFIGDGFTKEGQYPFIDEYDLTNLNKRRVYQASDKSVLENIVDVRDGKQDSILVKIQSKTKYPNYFIRSLGDNSLVQLTHFENPYKALEKASKEIFEYTRSDGLGLSGILYLPANYDKAKKEKLPLLIWAYPTEYKDKKTASQSQHSANEFTIPYYGSFVYWVNKGYAVLDHAAFPIVGEGSEEPNDTFIKQLVDNADAAIKALDKLGYIDPARVAVGGHSYGAFMTANLLTHSNLFACGIARSGAYNRTLTPFGFQSEQRNYWDVPELYTAMSPFAHAHKMKKPILLVHGEQDNNAGTFPIQTERYFQALKGLGAPARMVILPKESHGYRAQENIFHLMWEQEQFLDKCLSPKN